MSYLKIADYPDEKFVGLVVNGYEIQYVCDYKAKDGHKMYHGKCIHCNREFDRQKKEFLKDCNEDKNCKHVSWITNNFYVQTDCIINKRIRRTFSDMCRRCYNKENKDYRWYGAKGIAVCEKWLNRPDLFEKWAYENGYEDNLTIDRIDSYKNYTPENCQWITREENSRRSLGTNFYTIDGITLTGSEWSIKLNLDRNTINKYFAKYPYEQVIEFIKRRKADPTKTRKSKQTWMEVYGLE